jgi:hypothetical protein
MRACTSGACLMVLGLLAGCGGQSPSAPSQSDPPTPSGPGTSTTQSIVAAAMSQAVLNTAMTVSLNGPSRTISFPCANGGSMSMTFDTPTGIVTSGPLTTSSRIEFTDCRNQTVTINGDPAILMEGTYTFGTATGTGTLPSSMISTTRMTGGLRFDAAGVAGRARYDCTTTMSMQIDSNGTPARPTVTSTGTITWEQPLGTVAAMPCGR